MIDISANFSERITDITYFLPHPALLFSRLSYVVRVFHSDNTDFNDEKINQCVKNEKELLMVCND